MIVCCKNSIMENLKETIDPDHPNYYLDKEEMRDALREYKKACELAESKGEEVPVVPDYLAECFLNISKGLAMKYNFRSYSFNQDMVMDGVIKCLKGIRSFDPDMISEKTGKLVSPLAYFTQTCFYEFLIRIKNEEKQSSVKWSLLLKEDIDSYVSHDESGDFKLNLEDFIKCLGPQKFLEVTKEKSSKKKDFSSPLDEL